jgi:hypothetical protein
MCKTFTLLTAMLTVACVAQEQPIPGTGLVPEVVPAPIPARHIVPDEIVQESIQLVRFTNKQIGIRWTYTEAGASNMLAFREAREGQTVRTIIGTYESRPHEISFHPMPPTFTNYAQWKAGWLKTRTDKVVGVSEDDARKIIAGLKSQ